MGLFSWLKRKKPLPIEAQKWNKMWELWVEEKTATPYTELMTYQSEVNNGGHMQFFDNVSNTADLAQHIEALKTVLCGVLKENITVGYDAYLEYESLGEPEDEKFEQIFDRLDEVFYEYESEIEQILKDYAATFEV